MKRLSILICLVLFLSTVILARADTAIQPSIIVSNGTVTNSTITNSTANNLTVTSGTITGTSMTVKDLLGNFDIQTGQDSDVLSPAGTSTLSVTIGNQVALNFVNGSYNTFTQTAGNITNAAYTTTGTQNATATITGLTVGQKYRYIANFPSIVNQAPTILSANISPALNQAATNGVNTLYWRATSANVAIIMQNTAASNWTTTGTSLFAYSRPVRVRVWDHTTQRMLIFTYVVPSKSGDVAANNFTATMHSMVSNATAPAANETIVYSLSCGPHLSAQGTAVNMTYTGLGTETQGTHLKFPESATITCSGMTPGSLLDLVLTGETGTYGQSDGAQSFEIYSNRTIGP